MRLIKKIGVLLIVIFGLIPRANAQYFDSTQIANINTSRTASEGDLYQDTTKKNYFIGLTKGALTQINFNADSIVGSTFGIWAEESGELNAGNFEYAYGNGDNSEAGFGIVVPTDCEMFAVGLTLNEGNAEIEVYIDGVASGLRSGTAGASPSNAALNQLSVPRQIPAGTVINFRTVTATDALSGGKAVAWFRTITKVPTYKRYNGSIAPSAGLGINSDEYLNIITGDLFIKESGSWVSKINLKGATGTLSPKAFIQITNTVSGNINNTALTPFSWFDTTSVNVLQDVSTTFTKDTFGVTVNATGLYKVTVFQHQTSTVQRANAAVRISINGVEQTGYGANAYIRALAIHYASTTSVVKIVAASTGDEIGIVNEELSSVGSVICPVGTLVFLVEEL
jgi:hypothetical protein